jgi:hypothetical protein
MVETEVEDKFLGGGSGEEIKIQLLFTGTSSAISREVIRRLVALLAS